MGIVVKIADGSNRAVFPAVMSTLRQLNLLSKAEEEALAEYASPIVVHDFNRKIGEVRPALNFLTLYPITQFLLLNCNSTIFV